MTPVFLQSWSKSLLVVHALVAMALTGACTHQAVVCWRLMKGKPVAPRLARVYTQVIGWTFTVAFVGGLLMYPHYRYHVRGLYLDRHAVWASNLFDMKENLAALGLPVALALLYMGHGYSPSDERGLSPVFAVLSWLLWAMVAFSSVAGLLITSVKGV
jgi:hypothetical protein